LWVARSIWPPWTPLWTAPALAAFHHAHWRGGGDRQVPSGGRVRGQGERRGRAGAAGGCLDLGTDGLLFAPFAAVLRELVRDLGAEGVAALLPAYATREFARLLPEFGEADMEADPAVARARLFEQMLTLLERLAEAGPWS
jgi:hypothetical protein